VSIMSEIDLDLRSGDGPMIMDAIYEDVDSIEFYQEHKENEMIDEHEVKGIVLEGFECAIDKMRKEHEAIGAYQPKALAIVNAFPAYRPIYRRAFDGIIAFLDRWF